MLTLKITVIFARVRFVHLIPLIQSIAKFKSSFLTPNLKGELCSTLETYIKDNICTECAQLGMLAGYIIM